MTYVMTKPCPICKTQLTKQQPTETVTCCCGRHIGRDSLGEDTPALVQDMERATPMAFDCAAPASQAFVQQPPQRTQWVKIATFQQSSSVQF